MKTNTNNITPEQKFQQLFEEMYDLCAEQRWGDPFSYARAKEIYMAAVLGHTVSDTLSGANAIDKDGNKVEYKSTIQKTINATYNGISVRPTWEEQQRYLIEKKIECYPWHFLSRFEGRGIAEMYKAPGDKVLEKLMPKLKGDFHRKKVSQSSDPRLGASLSMTEIKEIGERIR